VLVLVIAVIYGVHRSDGRTYVPVVLDIGLGIQGYIKGITSTFWQAAVLVLQREGFMLYAAERSQHDTQLRSFMNIV
jgi:hypothetical protein